MPIPVLHLYQYSPRNFVRKQFSLQEKFSFSCNTYSTVNKIYGKKNCKMDHIIKNTLGMGYLEIINHSPGLLRMHDINKERLL